MTQKAVLTVLCLILSYAPALAQQKVGNKHFVMYSAPIFEISVATQIGTFNQLDKTLSQHVLERKASATYLTVGIGYGFHYKSLSLSSVGRYGFNLLGFNQYILDWNILRLSWAFTLNDRVRLSPVLGYGLLHIPVHLELAGNSQSSIQGLVTHPNSITIRNAWGYWNFGVSLSTHRINKTNLALSAIYSFGTTKSPWRNRGVAITDLPASAMNAIALSLSFSRY